MQIHVLSTLKNSLQIYEKNTKISIVSYNPNKKIFY